MAKGNMLLGTLRGSIGDVNFSRVEGKQVSKAKATSVKNPRTSKQTYQRMFFATIGKAKSAMKMIVDHSFEQIQHGTKSLSYFQSRNVELMRGDVYYDNKLMQWVSGGSYVTPKWPYMVSNTYRMSEGSLPVVLQIKPLLNNDDIINKPASIDYDLKELRRAIPFFMTQAVYAGQSIDPVKDIQFLLKAASCREGDYMTYVFTSRNSSEPATGEKPVPEAFHFIRFKVVKLQSTYEDQVISILTLVPSNIDGRQIALPTTIRTKDVVDEQGLSVKIVQFLRPMIACAHNEDGQVVQNSLLFAFDVNSIIVADFSEFEEKGVINYTHAGSIIGEYDAITSGCWIHSRPGSYNKLLVSTQSMLMADPSGDVFDYNLGIQDAYDAWLNVKASIGDDTLILEGGNK